MSGWSATLKANLTLIWVQVRCMHEFELVSDRLGFLLCMRCNTEGYDEDTHLHQMSLLKQKD